MRVCVVVLGCDDDAAEAGTQPHAAEAHALVQALEACGVSACVGSSAGDERVDMCELVVVVGTHSQDSSLVITSKPVFRVWMLCGDEEETPKRIAWDPTVCCAWKAGSDVPPELVELVERVLKDVSSAPATHTHQVMYAIGGHDSKYNALNHAETYNPTTDTWTPVAPMKTARSSLAAAVHRNRVYVMGGKVCGCKVFDVNEVYDPVTDTWETRAPMSIPRCELAAVTLGDYLYAIGGNSRDGDSLNVVERYDPVNDTWETVAPMLTPRKKHCAVTVNGCIYVFGGDYPATYEKYSPTTNTWEHLAGIPINIYSELFCVEHGGLVYIAGGHFKDNFHRYSPETDTWDTLSSVPTLRDNLGCATLNGCVYAVGGRRYRSASIVEKYDIASRTWRLCEDLIQGRLRHACVSLTLPGCVDPRCQVNDFVEGEIISTEGDTSFLRGTRQVRRNSKEEANFGGVNFSEDRLHDLAKALRSNTRLTSLHFVVCAFPRDGNSLNQDHSVQGFAEVMAAVALHPNIKTLAFDGCRSVAMASVNQGCVAAMLCATKTLTSLTLWCEVIDLLSVNMLQGFQLNRSLTTLKLLGTLNITTAADLFEALVDNHVLTTLSIWGLDQSGDENGVNAARAASALASNISLQELSIKDSTGLIVAGLKENTTLTTLTLFEAEDQTATHLATVLCVNTTLRSLEITFSETDTEGMLVLIAMQKNSTLLDLSMVCNIDAGVVKAAADMLRENTTLQSFRFLCLSVEGEIREAQHEFANSLRDNVGLRSLTLGESWVTNELVRAIASSLTANKTLTQLDLSEWYDINQEYVYALLECLQTNTTLVDLKLRRGSEEQPDFAEILTPRQEAAAAAAREKAEAEAEAAQTQPKVTTFPTTTTPPRCCVCETPGDTHTHTPMLVACGHVMCGVCVGSTCEVQCGVCCRVYPCGRDTEGAPHVAQIGVLQHDEEDVVSTGGDACEDITCAEAVGKMAETLQRLQGLRHTMRVVCETYEGALSQIADFEAKALKVVWETTKKKREEARAMFDKFEDVRLDLQFEDECVEDQLEVAVESEHVAFGCEGGEEEMAFSCETGEMLLSSRLKNRSMPTCMWVDGADSVVSGVHEKMKRVWNPFEDAEIM